MCFVTFLSGRSPEGGPGHLLQYSCLENPVDRGDWLDTPEAGMNVKEQGELKGHKRQITDNSLY